MKEVTLFFSGDFAPLFREGNKESSYFNSLKTLFSESDIHITNLECPLTNSNKSIIKTGPLLKGEEENISILKDAGVTHVCLANNHIFDYGAEGLESTIKVCEQNRIKTIGIVNRSDNKTSYIVEKIKGKTFGILNYCEYEFSVRDLSETGANDYDPIKSYYEITSLRTKVDFLIVIYHGGNEYYPLPRPGLKKTFHYLADLGADVVIGHHSHNYSGYESYKNKILVYSLGNFFFPVTGEPEMWYRGLLLKLKVGDSIGFQVIPVEFNNDKNILEISRSEAYDLDAIRKYSEIIRDDILLEEKWDSYCSGQSVYYLKTAHNLNRLKRLFLKFRFLRKSIFSKSHTLRLINLIRCQSHNEALLKAMKSNCDLK